MDSTISDHTIRKETRFNVRHDFLVCMFLVITTLSVYWQVKNHAFVNYDDESYVTTNIYVLNGLTLKGVTWSLTAAHASNWHPITWLSHMTDSQLYGMNAGMHHLTNVLFHIINTLLLFLVFRRMTGDIWRSGFVAALFALHPVHVESVAWVSERKDVLSAFFWMLTMWSYARYVERSELNRYLLVLMFFMLGLMAKPMIVTLPFVLLLLDYWPFKRFQSGQSGYGDNSQQRPTALGLIWEKMPFFILSAASSVATYLVQQSGGGVKYLDIFPFHARIGNAMVSYASYIGKMIWPHNLAVFYPYPEAIPLWQAAGAGLLLAIVTALVFRASGSKPYLAVGWLWYVGTLVPVIGLVQIGLQSMADRYTYMPLIGIFIIIAWGVPDLVPKWRYRKAGLAAITGATLSILMAVTWVQTGYWTNSIKLFEHALEVTANNYVAHHKLGEAMATQGKTAEAIRHYSEALRIKPDFVGTHLNIGVALVAKGKVNEAIDHFSEALRIKPDYADAHNNLGIALEEQGRTAEAVLHYIEALRLKPDYAEAHNNLGIALEEQGRTAVAIRHYLEALRIKPDFADAHLNLGVALIAGGKVDEAIDHFLEALRLNPRSAETHNNLGVALMVKGKIREASVFFREALRIKPDYSDAQDNHKKALAAQGKIDESVQKFKR